MELIGQFPSQADFSLSLTQFSFDFQIFGFTN